MADPHPVGIWDSLGTLVATATVPSGTAASLVSGFRSCPISTNRKCRHYDVTEQMGQIGYPLTRLAAVPEGTVAVATRVPRLSQIPTG